MKPPVNFPSFRLRHLFLPAVLLASAVLVISAAYFTPQVHADAAYNLTDLDDAVANALNIDSFSAGILVSAVILMFPTAMTGFALYRSKGPTILFSIIIVDFVTMAFLVALGWLPYYIFLILALLIGILMAGSLRDLITGKGG